MELIASAVVLSALSVPPYENNSELEHEMERNLKMANLICFTLENKTDSKTTVFYFPSFALPIVYRYLFSKSYYLILSMLSRSSLLAELVRYSHYFKHTALYKLRDVIVNYKHWATQCMCSPI
jgi:hypothetical protein